MKAGKEGLGYIAGSGGVVTQSTNINTAVTLNSPCGTITTVSQSIAAGATESFTVNNSLVEATDAVQVNLKSTSSAGGPWNCYCSAVAAGSFTLTIRNDSAATAGDNNPLIITIAVIKAVAA